MADKTFHDVFHHLTRDGKANAHISAGSRKDGGINANQLALQIDQSPT